MTETGALPSLLDLKDELLVTVTILSIMSIPEANTPSVQKICASALERCLALVEELVRMERAQMSEGEK